MVYKKLIDDCGEINQDELLALKEYISLLKEQESYLVKDHIKEVEEVLIV